ncbi:hypothetical protein [Longirhabdus pacifica]|uniref:hypothetical protein n=1 Tax=Longirhabdus pacifica TaxID=2305227 RepID=UPI001008C8C1|nr:hypothetical protein [Longirhabdus pacifica]
MRDEIKLACMMTLFLWFMFIVTPVQASDDESDHTIIPFFNIEQASEENINAHLVNMGFEESEINRMSLEFKTEIASNGGKKVETIKSSNVIQHHEWNRNFKLFSYASTPLLFAPPAFEIASTDNNNNDKFIMWAYVSKFPSSSSVENIYGIYVHYKWNSSPLYFYTDTLAVVWQGKAHRHEDPSGFGNKATVMSSGITNLSYWDLPADIIKDGGVSWKVDVKAGGKNTEQWGHGFQKIRADKMHEGTTGVIEIAYGHRLAPGSASLNIEDRRLEFKSVFTILYNDIYNFTY